MAEVACHEFDADQNKRGDDGEAHCDRHFFADGMGMMTMKTMMVPVALVMMVAVRVSVVRMLVHYSDSTPRGACGNRGAKPDYLRDNGNERLAETELTSALWRTYHLTGIFKTQTD